MKIYTEKLDVAMNAIRHAISGGSSVHYVCDDLDEGERLLEDAGRWVGLMNRITVGLSLKRLDGEIRILAKELNFQK